MVNMVSGIAHRRVLSPTSNMAATLRKDGDLSHIGYTFDKYNASGKEQRKNSVGTFLLVRRRLKQ